jgi:peptidoglycan/xylan/chitin deacetylase (PgdA/CDA1 family)
LLLAHSSGAGRALAGVAWLCLIAVAGCGGSTAQPRSHERPRGATNRALTTRSRPQPKPASVRAAPAHLVLVGQIPDRLPTKRRVIALTFDAGANDAGAPKIFSVLSRTHAAATFFMTGRWAETYPQWARRIAARYPIANHTFDHTNLLQMSLQGVRREILMAKAAIARVTGRPPIPLFRFPYGASSTSTLKVVNKLGYTAIGWTVDTLGWEGASMGQSTDSVFSRVMANLQPGEIVLMHVGSSPDHSTLDADTLDRIIHAARARGYQFVTLNRYW